MSTTREAAHARFAPVGEWTIDPAGTTAGFRIRKFFWHPKGRFRVVAGTLDATDGRFGLDASARVDCIATGLPLRDRHLRSSQFFDARRHPTVELELTEAQPLARGAFRLRGQLTLKGVRRPIELIAAGHGHGDHLRVRAEGTVDRLAHGLVGPRMFEMGGLMVGRRVELQLDVLLRRAGRPANRSRPNRGRTS